MTHPLLRRMLGAGLCAAALIPALAPASAADFPYPPSGGAPRFAPDDEDFRPPPPPRPAPRFSAGFDPAPPEACRTIVKRIEVEGEEIVRRVRICDEPAYPVRPRLRPSFYRDAPPPPFHPPLPPGEGPDEPWAGPPRW